MKTRILTVRIERDEIVIRIGINTLKCATEYSPALEKYGEVEVTDPNEWAQSVVTGLQNEEEDGTTPVHEMFDKAFWYAFEQGYEGIDVKEKQNEMPTVR